MTALYVHIPFCEKKCFYCSFVVSVGQQKRIDIYLDALSREAERYGGTSISSIYVGGGTPTFMNNDQLKRLLAIIKALFRVDSDVEITMEANPEDIEIEKACLLKELGVNRISFGAQTFNDDYLKFLGRCHDAAQAVKAHACFKEAGFQNINIDLMYSFPNQTLQDIKNDVKTLLTLQTQHVSLYTLTVDENSRFFVKNLKLHEPHNQSRHYESVCALLESGGFPQYEVSNFAKTGFESKHNLNYWSAGNYIGLGIGAHSHRDGRRSWNVSRLSDYLAIMQEGRDPTEGFEELTTEQRFLEALLIGLRMNTGVDLQMLQESFQCQLSAEKYKQMQNFIAEGFFTQRGQRLQASMKGRLILDELASYII